MQVLREKFKASPIYVRVAPFFIFLVLTFIEAQVGEGGRYWMYLAKTLVGAWLIWEMWSFVAEMRWAVSWEAVVVGAAVCAVWVGLDPYYPQFAKPKPPWNPHPVFGQGSGLAWMFVAVHWLGSTLVVPPLEEVFYRSFLYRYFVKLDFPSMPFCRFHGLSFVVTSLLFGLVHYEWLAGILCGMAYQWLVLRKNRLGDAMTAHAVTNFLLGAWVVWRGAWHFW
jgi:CAAX protease family protein